MIDFTLSPEQDAIRGMAISFSSAVLSNAAATYGKYTTQHKEKDSNHSGRSIAKLSKGGKLFDATILVGEMMYKSDRSVSLTIFGTGLGLSPLLVGGTPAQHEEFLKPFLSSEGEPLASLVHSEPGGAANYLEKGGKGLQTVARKEGDDWIVNGDKMWVTNCCGWDDRGADLQCLVCRSSQDGKYQDLEADPTDAIMILLVTRDVINSNEVGAYQVVSHAEYPGHESTAGPHTRFKEFRVPGHNLLAAPGKGAEIVGHSFTSSAALVGAMSVGIMSASFKAVHQFAKLDSRGARSLLSRQSVSDFLMDIKMRTDAARFLTWKAANPLDNGKGPELCLEAKIYCSDLAVSSVVDAMSAVGMSSYNKDTVFPSLLNDAICLPLFDGGNIGVRRRQLEKLMAADGYEPWGPTFG